MKCAANRFVIWKLSREINRRDLIRIIAAIYQKRLAFLPMPV